MQVLTFAVAFNNPEHTGRLNLDIYIYIGTICSLSSKRVLHVYDVHQRTVSPFNSICGYVDYPFSSPFAKFLIWLIGLLNHSCQAWLMLRIITVVRVIGRARIGEMKQVCM